MNLNENLINQWNNIYNKQNIYYEIIEKYEDLVKKCYEVELKYKSNKNQTSVKNMTVYNSESTNTFIKTITDLNNKNKEFELINNGWIKNVESLKNNIENLETNLEKKNKDYEYLLNLYEEQKKNNTTIENEYSKLKLDYDNIIQQIIIEKNNMAEKLMYINEQEEKIRIIEKDLKEKAKNLDEKNNKIKKHKNPKFNYDNENNDEFLDLEIKVENVVKKELKNNSKILFSNFNMNEDKIFFSFEDYSLLSFSPNFGNVIDSFKFKNKLITCIDCDFSEQNNILIGGTSNNVEVYNIQRERTTLTLNHKDVVNSCRYFENNKAFSCSSDNTIKLWDLRKGSFINSMYYHSSPIFGITDTTLFYTGHRNGTLSAWNSNQKTPVYQIDLKNKIDFLKINSQENSLICSSRFNEINIVDTRTLKVRTTLDIHNYSYESSKYSLGADKEFFRLYIGDDKGNLLIYDILNEKPKLEKTIKISNCELNQILFSDINDLLINTDIKGNIFFNKCSINI